jgi:hypothetical protein
MNKIYIMFIGLFCAAVILIGLSATGMLFKPGKYDNFAKCLSQKGAVMYGSDTCHACQSQKQLFGDSFGYVTYINCINNQQLCMNENIASIPTWRIGSAKYVGVQELSRLAELSGCTIS